MPVVFDSEKRVFKLDTPSSSYAMKISPTGYLLHLYYGAYVPDTDLDYLRMRQRTPPSAPASHRRRRAGCLLIPHSSNIP